MTLLVESISPTYPRIHSTGSLNGFKPIMLTPVIGNEFLKGSINIVDDIIRAPNSDQRIKDLAVMSMHHPLLHYTMKYEY
jgi:hypothetical protein